MSAVRGYATSAPPPNPWVEPAGTSGKSVRIAQESTINKTMANVKQSLMDRFVSSLGSPVIIKVALSINATARVQLSSSKLDASVPVYRPSEDAKLSEDDVIDLVESQTPEVLRFISELGLEEAVNKAKAVVKEVFTGIKAIMLELDESEGDRHIRLYVDSDMSGDNLFNAYERFYLELNQRLPIEQRAYIGLAF